MIKCKELNKEFATKEDLFKALKSNKDTILAAKKSEIKTGANILGFYNEKTGVIKGIPNMDADYIYPVISNTNYIDSHKDVHLNGSMTKTAKEQNRKVYYVADHKLEVDSIIATPKNVEIQLVSLKWSDLGRNYDGETEALIFKIAKDKIIHEKFKSLLADGEELQNSIRMQYLKIDFGINSNDEEFKSEKKVYDDIYPSIANKEQVDEDGYFFAVRELKIVNEGSAVLFGSNDATPIKTTEAVVNTSETKEADANHFDVSQALHKINIKL